MAMAPHTAQMMPLVSVMAEVVSQVRKSWNSPALHPRLTFGRLFIRIDRHLSQLGLGIVTRAL
jgi:hypothetical protein